MREITFSREAKEVWSGSLVLPNHTSRFHTMPKKKLSGGSRNAIELPWIQSGEAGSFADMPHWQLTKPVTINREISAKLVSEKSGQAHFLA